MRIDLNADVGEGATEAAVEAELALIPYLTSVNVACGGHAGDPRTMRRTVETARHHHVSVGAHPGYIDRDSFGRRALSLPLDTVRAMVADQIAALVDVAAAAQVSVVHVKPHGALYNQAAADFDLSFAIAEAIRATSPALTLVGLAGSSLIEAGRHAGLPVAAEAFVDRAYQRDGSLVARSHSGAILDRPETAARQALSIARDRTVISIDGSRVAIHADTLCLHGDTAGALAIVRAVRHTLEDAGITIAAPNTSR